MQKTDFSSDLLQRSSIVTVTLTTPPTYNEPVPTNVPYLSSSFQMLVYVVVSYVVPTTLTELIIPEKSITSLIVLALTTPIAMDFLKLCANTSTLLRDDLPIYWRMDVLEASLLLLIFAAVHGLNIGENWTALGLNASITVPGITLKLLTEFVLAHCFEEVPQEQSTIKRWFFPKTEHTPKNDWYHLPIVFHLARYAVLVSALIAGGELLEAIKIGSNSSVGDKLVDLFHECGATSSAAVNAGALLVNEIIGMTLLLGTGWFAEIYPSYASRLLTLIVMTTLFQWLSIMIPLLKSEGLGILFLSASVTFLVDYLVQLTPIAPAIDDCLNQKLPSLLMNCCSLFKEDEIRDSLFDAEQGGNSVPLLQNSDSVPMPVIDESSFNDRMADFLLPRITKGAP